ncbi:hypothetical protein KEM54_003026, partial [Ascosphaera aggregata]
SVFAIQQTAPRPVPAPLRELHWGQLNFLHTTDVHGWLSGHLREPSFAADWGDYVSFAEHMRKQADDGGNDLLLVDTGDRVEGSGLYDMATPPGKYLYDIFQQQQIDLLCIGNHELYKAATADAEYQRMASHYNTSYISSNVDIYDSQLQEYVPLAQRYKKFTTKNQEIRIMAFGFLYNFLGNANNTIVHTVESTIKQNWFQSAIRDPNIDLILVVGHVPVHSDEYTALYRAIRQVRWDMPIQFFGGHQHIRDYARYDSQAYGLASGRFLETYGFASISGLSSAHTPHVRSAPVSFHRRYIDNNLYSLHHHSGKNATTFPTEKGLLTTQMITDARAELELDLTHGCSPENYWVSRAKYPEDNSSVYTWLSQEVFPAILRNETRSHTPSFVLTNTGAVRFDILKGPFTRDSAATFSPFTSIFKYTKDVPYDKAKRLLELLNAGPTILESGIKSLPGTARQRPMAIPEEIGRAHDLATSGTTNSHDDDLLYEMQVPLQSSDGSPIDLIPGYTTTDDEGDAGDDTIHARIPFYHTPNCFSSLALSTDDDLKSAALQQSSEYTPKTVDLVYNDFLEPWITSGAKIVGFDFNAATDADAYLNRTVAELVTDWVKVNWACKTDPYAHKHGVEKVKDDFVDSLFDLFHDL